MHHGVAAPSVHMERALCRVRRNYLHVAAQFQVFKHSFWVIQLHFGVRGYNGFRVLAFARPSGQCNRLLKSDSRELETS